MNRHFARTTRFYAIVYRTLCLPHCYLARTIIVMLTSCSPVTMAAESLRAQEINDCRSGEIVTWADGIDHPVASEELLFTYDPLNAPVRFPESLVSDMVAKAALAWSGCGITGRLIPRPEASRRSNVIQVQWNEAESRGNFGLSNLGKHTLSLSANAFDNLNTVNPSYDTRITLQMVISHEMGHHYGLMAHSRRCIDVLSYYDNGKGEKCTKRNPFDTGGVTEYRHNFPTTCDLARCRAVNGK